MRRISARSIEWIAFAASSAVILLYAGFAAFDYVLLGTGQDNCVNARKAPVADERGVRAEARARFCDLIGWPNEKRLGLHLSDDLAIRCLSSTNLGTTGTRRSCAGSTTIN